MRGAVIVGVIGAVLALASCGGDNSGGEGTAATNATEVSGDTTVSDEGKTDTTADTGSGDASEVDACGLVTDEEVSAILGFDVSAVPQPNVSGGSVCHWEVAGDGFYTVRLTVGPADLYEILKSNQASDLDGLGDEAWSAYVGEIDIGVLVGDYHILVFLDEADDVSESDALDMGVQFTQAVLDGLGE